MVGDKENKIINYDRQINRMILFMIKNILRYSSQKGLPGNHHFYIKFATTHPDFLILNNECGSPDIELMAKYPTDMTIVLQNSFTNLYVEDSIFSVMLNFNSQPKKLIIPFASLLTFFDPFANFSVKLDPEKNNGEDFLDFMEYDCYEFYDDEDDENDEISNFFKYDYEKYKIEEDVKLVYFDDIKKRIKD